MTNAVNLASAAGTGFAFRNRIINGDMRIDQRNGGGSITTTGWPVDRWFIERGPGNTASFSASRSTDVPSGQGYTNSLAINFSSADTGNASNNFFAITQFIEGNNIADLGWGASGAKAITVSFWVKSPVAGTYSCTLYNNGAGRINPQGFTINAANTWEYKTVAYSGDTTGTWLADTGRGIVLNIYLKLWTGTQGSGGWNAGTQYGVTQVNGNSTTGVFAITGVQLEVGSVATPFERRPYGLELALCQRYYQTYPNTITYRATPFSSSFAVRQTGMLCVPMRAAPSVTVTTSGIGNQSTTTNVIGAFTSHVQFEAVTPNSTAWGNPHYDVAYNASAEL